MYVLIQASHVGYSDENKEEEEEVIEQGFAVKQYQSKLKIITFD